MWGGQRKKLTRIVPTGKQASDIMIILESNTSQAAATSNSFAKFFHKLGLL